MASGLLDEVIIDLSEIVSGNVAYLEHIANLGVLGGAPKTGGQGVESGPCSNGAAGGCRESEGVPQIFFLMSPKIEDPPQEEWGIKGVENEFNNSDG